MGEDGEMGRRESSKQLEEFLTLFNLKLKTDPPDRAIEPFIFKRSGILD